MLRQNRIETSQHITKVNKRPSSDILTYVFIGSFMNCMWFALILRPRYVKRRTFKGVVYIGPVQIVFRFHVCKIPHCNLKKKKEKFENININNVKKRKYVNTCTYKYI